MAIPGYGAATPEGLAAMEVAAGQGLNLEVTYTAKCLAALMDRATRSKLPNGPIVFWNTHNSVDLAARAPRPPDRSQRPTAISGLPRRNRRLRAERVGCTVGP